MRILQISASVAASDGGPAEVILSLDRELKSRGHNVTLLTTDANGFSGRLERDDREALRSLQHANVHRAHAPRRLKASAGLLAQAVRQAGHYDIAHVHGTYLAHDLTAYLVDRRGLPFVTQLHGVFEPYQRSQGTSAKRAWDAVIGTRSRRRSAAFIVAAESEREGAQAVLPAAIPTYVVPLGASVDGPRLPPPGWDVPDHVPVLLFFGRYANKKRPDLLLQAWAEVDSSLRAEAVLVLAGPDGDWSAEQLRAMSRELSVEGSTRVLPLQLEDHKRFLLGRALQFVLPSENENFGIAVAEAMASGTSVLTTDLVAASTHVLAAGAGVVTHGVPDAAQLAALLSRTLHEEARITEQGRAGKAYAAQHLSWAATASLLETIYMRHARPDFRR